MHGARRRDETDQSGEHHEEHHPRLHQREVVGDVAAGLGFDRPGCYRNCDVGHASLTQAIVSGSSRSAQASKRLVLI